MFSGRTFRICFLAAAIIPLLGVSCKDQNNPIVGNSPSNIVFPVRDVSYGAHVQPLFNQTCTFAGCHDDGAPSNRVKLTTYGHTRYDFDGVVIPGEPENSRLVQRIEGRIGQRMPLNLSPLNQNQIDGIRTWIVEGARNN